MQKAENPPFGDLLLQVTGRKLLQIEIDVCDRDKFENIVVFCFILNNRFSIGTGTAGSSTVKRVSMLGVQ